VKGMMLLLTAVAVAVVCKFVIALLLNVLDA
jgi:hypothetical protein